MAIDFSLARTAHLAWKARLRSFLDGKQTLTEAQAVSQRDCDLGKWLYGEGMAKYGTLSEMRELERVHADLHGTVKRIVELKRSGNAPAAEQEFTKIDPISHRIIALLTTIEQKVK